MQRRLEASLFAAESLCATQAGFVKRIGAKYQLYGANSWRAQGRRRLKQHGIKMGCAHVTLQWLRPLRPSSESRFELGPDLLIHLQVQLRVHLLLVKTTQVAMYFARPRGHDSRHLQCSSKFRINSECSASTWLSKELKFG
jgi:hypothetical protein